jgi:hypothetical protein
VSLSTIATIVEVEVEGGKEVKEKKELEERVEIRQRCGGVGGGGGGGRQRVPLKTLVLIPM